MLLGNTFVFDIETVPDIEGARKLHPELKDLEPNEVADHLFSQRRQTAGTDFLRHHLHKIAAISIVFKSHDAVKVWSLGDETSTEAELIERFFHGIEKYQPTLVSWNGAGFDLPVLHYRALINQIQAPSYWEQGEREPQFKWNNYINRFHFRHIDLMDVLAGYQMKTAAPLDQIATLLGFPGKMGMDGSKVWPAYLEGDLKGIRDYCETDVLNTYLVFLQFEYMRGHLTQNTLQEAQTELQTHLRSQTEAAHLQSFLTKWEAQNA